MLTQKMKLTINFSHPLIYGVSNAIVFIGPFNISTDNYHAGLGQHPLLQTWTRLTITRQHMTAKPKLSSFIL